LPFGAVGQAPPKQGGGRGEKNDESDVHLPQLQERKQLITLFYVFLDLFLSRFWAFRNRGVQKH
jgi:hypothetical protein